MRANIKKQKTNKFSCGFTLVELIVVFVILTILSAVMIPSFSGYIKKAKKAQCISSCYDLELGYKSAFVEDHQKNPASVTDQFRAEVERGLELSDHADASCSGNPAGPLTITGLCESGSVTAVRRENGEIALYCSVHGSSFTDESGFATQSSKFVSGLNEWMEANGNAFGSNASSSSKSMFFADYYGNHPENIVKMTDTYKQNLVKSGLNNTLKNQQLYWWTYPVTDAAGHLLYSVTYANNQSNAEYWTNTNRGKMNPGYVVIVNGKTYYRTNSGKTVEPGNSTNPYKTEDELETALIASGYKVLQP